MKRRFEGQVVWITGASDGIGAACAARFVEEGAHVVISARRREKLEQVAARIGVSKVSVAPLDVSDEAACERVAAEVIEAHGRVDVLVLNAGIGQRGEALATPLEQVREVMAVNFYGAIALARAVVPQMVARGGGRVVAVTSIAGQVATPLRAAYAASKHAMHGWFDALRAELHGTGVSVTLVMPGYVRTDIAVHAKLADGSRQGRRDKEHEAGIAPEVCAEALADATWARRDQLIVGGPEIYAVYLKRLVPWVVARLIHRFAPTTD
jgi:short-subunit dehydrogenase